MFLQTKQYYTQTNMLLKVVILTKTICKLEHFLLWNQATLLTVVNNLSSGAWRAWWIKSSTVWWSPTSESAIAC